MEETATGPVVECGCFQAGKELHIYDTFQGLPDSEPELVGAETGINERADDLGYFLKTPKPANSHP